MGPRHVILGAAGVSTLRALGAVPLTAAVAGLAADEVIFFAGADGVLLFAVAGSAARFQMPIVLLC